jgi:thiamine-phosphate pyrophosphorylase
MKRCHITNRKLVGGVEGLLKSIARNDAAGVDLIQIREKDLSTRELCALVQRAVAICRHARVIVNSRLDVALACGAHGVHLPGDAPLPGVWRKITPPGFLIGVSCHTVEDLRMAEGADYAFFSPIFRPLSKDDARAPLGLDALRKACTAVALPVYALGGITEENAGDCIAAGAAGVAGITLFQRRGGAKADVGAPLDDCRGS